MSKNIISCCVLLLFSTQVFAQTGVEHLQHFLKDITSYSAEFDQVVLDEELRQIDDASGTLTIFRPGRFRWDYYPPVEQQIVGDGEKVWIYDLELRQVIVRDQKSSLGQTPAILLASEDIDLARFTLKDQGGQGKVQWVKIIPKDENSGFDDVQVGFVDGKLSTMVLVDGLGQTTRINFTNPVENPILPGEQFIFEPPEGVDVIDETQ